MILLDLYFIKSNKLENGGWVGLGGRLLWGRLVRKMCQQFMLAVMVD